MFLQNCGIFLTQAVKCLNERDSVFPPSYLLLLLLCHTVFYVKQMLKPTETEFPQGHKQKYYY